jgi:hypothetical protein
MMHWGILTGSIFAHMIGYFALLRRLNLFARERAILAYHLLISAIVLFWVFVIWWNQRIDLSGAVGLLSLQFIYSMTFLEFWSLTQGSYSLQLLSTVCKNDRISRSDLVSRLAVVGDDKKRDRLADLASLGLVQPGQNSEFRLTKFGQCFVLGVKLLMRVANIKVAG